MTVASFKPPSSIKKDPRISLNKLGEYLEATAPRRRSILKDQKKPPGAGILAWYGPVNAALSEYFENPNQDFIKTRIEQLKADKSGTEWDRNNRTLSADALERMIDMLQQLDLQAVRIEPFSSTNPYAILIAGVKVSVRPEFIVIRKSDDVIVGALKISHTKQHSLSKSSCEYIATVLRRFLDSLDDTAPDPKWCLSLSTPNKFVVCAPKAFKTREATIEVACEEIAAVWSKA